MQVKEQEQRPVVAAYCATFLRPEMLHIYRQITALDRVRPIVITQKREEPERFPYPAVSVVPKPRTHFLRRIWFRQLRDAPWKISNRETNAIIRVLETAEARLLHIYFGHIAVHLLPLIRQWDKPSVVSFHGADVMVDLAKPAYRRATEEMLDAVRLVLVRSNSLARALNGIGCPSEKIRVQRTGIPLDELPFRERQWPANGQWHLLQAGRLIPKKGIATSLLTFAEFRKRYPHSTLTLAGEGPLRGELELLSQKLGVAEGVTFTGFVTQRELRDLFHRSHIFLHPSETGADGNQEGVPNAMLEAMASGLPVFATMHGGIPEAIEHGLSGMLVPEGDVDALARELLKAAADPTLLTGLSQAGAKAVADNFEQRAQVRKLEDFYFEAMRPPG